VCISKDKSHKRYDFGNKLRVGKGFILSSIAYHGNLGGDVTKD